MAIWQSLALISSGAALGASLRWGLGLLMNPLFTVLSFGTLVANYLGCFIIGILTALIWQFPYISQEWRLFLITGFLGSLTTFSSFSAEVVEKLFNGQWSHGAAIILLHVVGCLAVTVLGICCVKWLVN
ncbi:MAG TPA: fluoride efflux transporter CrcB [Pasteurellaceae bacterium]|nr:fluoride efflux transporter CrcB [Pasteurellaceae bacterium]